MIPLMLIALVNGAVIGTSRALNGRLSQAGGPFRASFWNHLVGFGALSAALLIGLTGSTAEVGQAPVYAYLGGLVGVLYVALNSLVLPRLGNLTAMALVVSSQLVTGLIIDALTGLAPHRSLPTLGIQVLGVTLIVIGVSLPAWRRRQSR